MEQGQGGGAAGRSHGCTELNGEAGRGSGGHEEVTSLGMCGGHGDKIPVTTTEGQGKVKGAGRPELGPGKGLCL